MEWSWGRGRAGSYCLLVVALCAPAARAGFTVELVDGDSMWETSLTLDRLGRPHLAYGSVHLYHAVFDAGSWTTETVDPDDYVGRGASIAIDGAGYPAISYGDSANKALRFARFDGSIWRIETIDPAAVVYFGTSLGFDAGGNPVIAYYDDLAGLKAARWDGATWIIDMVEVGGAGFWTGRYNHLAIDPSGQPAVSYVAGDTIRYALKFARWTGSQWLSEVVDSTSLKTGRYSSLAFDGAGNAGIAYRDDSAGGLRVARWTGAAWSLETVDAATDTGSITSIAFNSANRAIVSYGRYAPFFELRLARDSGGGWTTERVDPQRAVAATSLRLDSLDRPIISYLGYAVRVARWDGSAWTFDDIAEDRQVGDFPSLALDAAGAPLISYRDDGESQLDLARRSGATWSHEVVDSGYDTGWGTSLVIDSADQPLVTCFDNDLGGVTFAEWDGSQWNLEAVERTSWGSLYDSPSLELDATGAPAVAYYDGNTYVLKYASRRTGSWVVETVDAAGDVGEYPSLAFDGSGNPAISYFDYDLEQLKYAHWDGLMWRIEVVDVAAGAGDDGSSLVFDASDVALIAYTDYDPQQLKLARRLGPGWAIEVIDPLSETGHAPSIAIDPKTGLPCVSYHAGYDETLKFARLEAGVWIREVVDPAWDVGYPSSLVMNVAGLPEIAYRDYEFQTLKYASRTDWGFQIRRGTAPASLQPIADATLAWTDPEPVLSGGYPRLLMYQAGGLDAMKLTKSGQSVRLNY